MSQKIVWSIITKKCFKFKNLIHKNKYKEKSIKKTILSIPWKSQVKFLENLDPCGVFSYEEKAMNDVTNVFQNSTFVKECWNIVVISGFNTGAPKFLYCMYVYEGDIQQIYYRIIPGILRDKTIKNWLRLHWW